VVDIFQFQLHCGPGVNSAFNRNEYQEDSWGLKGGWCVRLTTLLPSVSRLFRENVGVSTSHNPMGLHNLLQGYLYLYNVMRYINSKAAHVCTQYAFFQNFGRGGEKKEVLNMNN
jgi:hypothetical protein